MIDSTDMCSSTSQAQGKGEVGDCPRPQDKPSAQNCDHKKEKTGGVKGKQAASSTSPIGCFFHSTFISAPAFSSKDANAAGKWTNV